jgi:hypothetical protein
MAVLPLQGAATGKPWSLTRDTQLRTLLEGALQEVLSPGVISGGAVTATTGYSVEVASGSVFHLKGVLLTLSVAQAYTAAVASSTVYLWAKITRTAADQTQPTASDTYALTVTHNTTGVSPGAEYFCLAILATDAAGITSVNSDPPGKYARPTTMLGLHAITLTAGSTTLTADQYQSGFLSFSGSGNTVVFPAAAGRRWFVENALSSDLECTTAAGEGVTLAAGEKALLTTDGTDVLRALEDPVVSSLSDEIAVLEARLYLQERDLNRVVYYLGLRLAPELIGEMSSRFTAGSARR